MNEFNNRISAQREILHIINSKKWAEDIFGLSSGAIKRWALANNIKGDSELLQTIKISAEKLFFLANKSQEQITNEYAELSREVSNLAEKIHLLINK